jgi:hypothetical protein
MFAARALFRTRMPVRTTWNYGLPKGCPGICYCFRFVAGTFSGSLVPTNRHSIKSASVSNLAPQWTPGSNPGTSTNLLLVILFQLITNDKLHVEKCTLGLAIHV